VKLPAVQPVNAGLSLMMFVTQTYLSPIIAFLNVPDVMEFFRQVIHSHDVTDHTGQLA